LSAIVADGLRDSHSAARQNRPARWPAWRFWRSPADQPSWARPALLTIAALAAVLYAWNITSSGYAYFYSDAVKSMSVSWKALFFGAMDPGATITPDKIAGSFVPQALSVRIFGFHAWSVTLPQVVEGVISVLVLYRAVRRWAGPRAGLAAAGLFTFTPVVASMFGHSMEDGGLVFCLVMAADSYQRAVSEARLRALLLAGVWVGIGFQAKMIQAWMILPALAVGYLVAAPVPLRRRIGQLLMAGVVCAAVSLSWVALMTVVPAKDRPYVDGSTNNSAVAMVFGYNALERFGIHLPGAVVSTMGGMGGARTPGGAPGGQAGSAGAGTGANGAAGGAAGAPGAGGGGFRGAAGGGGGGFPGRSQAGGGAAPGGAAGGFPGGSQAGGGAGAGMGGRGGSGWLKLFEGSVATQIGWMYPFALLGLAFGFWWCRREGRSDRLRGGFVMWGSWLIVVGLVFSKMSAIPHTAYYSTLAPALAALAGTGAVMMWDAYRNSARSGWALPVAVAAEAAWTWYLGSYESGFLPWLRWLALAASLVGLLAMVWGKVSPSIRSRLLVVGVLTGLAGAVVSPVAWASSVLDVEYAGTSFNASAGPAAQSRLADVASTLSADQRKLYDYIKARQKGATYVLATDGWNAASPYILATGDKIMPMGGFSGTVPQPSFSSFESMVKKGELRYFLISGRTSGSSSVTQIDSWVKKNCSEVSSTAYGVKQTSTSTTTSGRQSPAGGSTGGSTSGGTAGAGMPAGQSPFAGNTGTLYNCSPSS